MSQELKIKSVIGFNGKMILFQLFMLSFLISYLFILYRQSQQLFDVHPLWKIYCIPSRLIRCAEKSCN